MGASPSYIHLSWTSVLLKNACSIDRPWLYLLYRWKINHHYWYDYYSIGCIRRSQDRFDLETLKKRLIFICNVTCPQYELGYKGKWPINRSINSDTIFQLDSFCRKKGIRSEVPCVKAFFHYM